MKRSNQAQPIPKNPSRSNFGDQEQLRKPNHFDKGTQLFHKKIEQYLSVKDISVLYGVSEKTVRGWIYKGILTPERVGPRLIRFKKSDIEQWVSQKKGEPYGNNEV